MPIPAYRSRALPWGLALLAALLIPDPAFSQEVPSAVAGRGPAVAARTSQPISLDGVLDEAAWAAAAPATDFTQIDPEEGVPVTERTEVRILYDDDNLHVGASFYDRSPVTSHLARRDVVMFDSDKFTVAFDSYRDGLTAYRFHTNPAGVRRDTRLSGGQLSGGDASWNPVWDVRTTGSDSGWVAEMRIPFSQLLFAEGPEQLWGIQLERLIARRQEEAWFSFVPKSASSGIAAAPGSTRPAPASRSTTSASSGTRTGSVGSRPSGTSRIDRDKR